MGRTHSMNRTEKYWERGSEFGPPLDYRWLQQSSDWTITDKHQPANANASLFCRCILFLCNCPLCVQDRNRTNKKGGGGNLTKRVGGITKSQSAETRASNPHWQPHSTFHATSSNISLVFCAVDPSHSETPRFLGNQRWKRWMEGERERGEPLHRSERSAVVGARSDD